MTIFRERPISGRTPVGLRVKEKRLRVLIVYGDLLEYRIPIFAKLGEEVDLTVTHSGKRLTSNDAGFSEIVLPLNRLWRFKFQRRLRGLIRDGKFDAVIYFMDIAWISTVFNFLFPPRPVRRITWGLWRTGRKLPDAIRIWLSKWADHNVFYSTGAAQDFITCGLSQETVSVARNTVRVENPARNNMSHRDSVLVVGSFNRRKRNDLTLQAFSNVVQRRGFPVRLVFVGAGEELDLIRSLALTSPASDQIEFHPPTHHTTVLRTFYDRAVCSVSYGQAGLSVLQSFAFGVPFVTCKGAISGGEIENIESGVNGFLISDSMEHLETALERLLSTPKEAEAMGLAALAYYTNQASVEQMITGFLNALDDGAFSSDERDDNGN